jgi:hypothetical protein
VDKAHVSAIIYANKHYCDSLFVLYLSRYELASADSHFRQGALGPALKNYLAVEKHYTDMVEDQFDFHTYCLRKMTLRSYVQMLKFQDHLHSYPYFHKAAIGAIRSVGPVLWRIYKKISSSFFAIRNAFPLDIFCSSFFFAYMPLSSRDLEDIFDLYMYVYDKCLVIRFTMLPRKSVLIHCTFYLIPSQIQNLNYNTLKEILKVKITNQFVMSLGFPMLAFGHV